MEHARTHTHTHTHTQCRYVSCLQLTSIWLSCIYSDWAVPMLYRLLNILNVTPRDKELLLRLQDASGFHTNNHPWQMRKFLKFIKGAAVRFKQYGPVFGEFLACNLEK